jgi:uncharacterized protein (DUF433 family)
MMSESFNLYPGLAHGAYTYKEAAAIIGVSPARVRRWADGYAYKRRYVVGQSLPILQTSRDTKVLNFYEMIELLFVREYVELNVTIPSIRATAERLAENFGPYPFANADLYVAGRELVTPLENGVSHRADIGQLVSDFAAKKVLVRTKFDQSNRIVYAYTMPDFDRVTLNARIKMGEPTVSDHAIPTRSIYRLWIAEKAFEPVCDYFDIELGDIKAAIEFESKVKFSA